MQNDFSGKFDISSKIEDMIWASIIVSAVEREDWDVVYEYAEKVNAKKARNQKVINDYFSSIATKKVRN
jgi:hypothetical protein